jgi:hypothetical protein
LLKSAIQAAFVTCVWPILQERQRSVSPIARNSPLNLGISASSRSPLIPHKPPTSTSDAAPLRPRIPVLIQQNRPVGLRGSYVVLAGNRDVDSDQETCVSDSATMLVVSGRSSEIETLLVSVGVMGQDDPQMRHYVPCIFTEPLQAEIEFVHRRACS